jgi:hypothetical protein
MPRAAISSTSATLPVSMNSLMPPIYGFRIDPPGRDGGQASGLLPRAAPSRSPPSASARPHGFGVARGGASSQPGPPQQHVGHRARLLEPGGVASASLVRLTGDDRPGHRGPRPRASARCAPHARSGRQAAHPSRRAGRRATSRRGAPGHPRPPACRAGSRSCGRAPRGPRARPSCPPPASPSAARWSACRR